MSSTVEIAISKVRSIGNRLCENQVYCFDDYDGDPTALCERLGIPVTDDIVIEYPGHRTFSPIPVSRIATLEERLNATLPDDYKRLLGTLGAFHLPGNASICVYSPETAISTTCGGWQFADPSRMPLLAIAPYHATCDGDSIGFLRSGRSFGPDLYHFKHELRYRGDDPKEWTTRITDSLSDFIIAYVDSLT